MRINNKKIRLFLRYIYYGVKYWISIYRWIKLKIITWCNSAQGQKFFNDVYTFYVSTLFLAAVIIAFFIGLIREAFKLMKYLWVTYSPYIYKFLKEVRAQIPIWRSRLRRKRKYVLWLLSEDILWAFRYIIYWIKVIVYKIDNILQIIVVWLKQFDDKEA